MPKSELAAAAGVAAMISLGATAALADPVADLAAIKAAAARYQEVKVALADGYVPDPAGQCVSAAHEGLPAGWGSMGIHYLHPGLLRLTADSPRVNGEGIHTDWLRPSILLYEPQADGSLRLVGVENLVFKKAWEAAGNGVPPSFAGRTWDHMADNPATPADEAHGFAPHYDQHVWFVGAPEHALLPFNPAVSCKHHKTAHAH